MKVTIKKKKKTKPMKIEYAKTKKLNHKREKRAQIL